MKEKREKIISFRVLIALAITALLLAGCTSKTSESDHSSNDLSSKILNSSDFQQCIQTTKLTPIKLNDTTSVVLPD